MDGFGWTIVQIISLTRDIKRADEFLSTAIENMGVDHRGFDIAATEELLDGADVVAALQEVSGEGVAADAFGEVDGSGGLLECFLESAFVEIVALPRVLF